MITKWEAAGRNVRPHYASQAALDECLRRCTPEEVVRFEDARRNLPTSGPSRRYPIRWSLVIDLPPADIGLAQMIAAAVNAVLDGQSLPPQGQEASEAPVEGLDHPVAQA